MNKQDILFAAFIRQHQAGLRAFVRGMGVESHAVDDIAQEAFLVAYRELERFDQDMDFGNWLYGIARNLVRNEIRKGARQGRIMNEQLSHYLISEYELNYEPSDYDGDKVKALQECISELPEKSKGLLNCKYTEEESTNAISEKFEMTSTAVRLALMRIRTKLKSCVDFRLGYEH